MSSFASGQLAEDMKLVSQTPPNMEAVRRLSERPYYNALMRSTCVATMLEAGHAVNALPQSAKAICNCRILPGIPQSVVLKEIHDMLADSQIVVHVMDSLLKNPPSPYNAAFMKTVEKVTEKQWPGIPVITVMGVGASDGIYLRGGGIPTYGISGVSVDMDDKRAHGKDERIGVKEFYDGLEYIYVLMRAFSSGE